MKTILEELAEERAKQVAKGFDARHDDLHAEGQIAVAASCVAEHAWAKMNGANVTQEVSFIWPWSKEDWDRISRHDPRRLLVIAAALTVAEIERLDRLAP